MPPSPVVDLTNSFGAVFIGLLVCLTLFGLALAQTWMYFWHCWEKDTKAFKSFIAFIIIAATIQTTLNAYTLYWYLVRNFSNVEALATIEWFFIVQGNFGGLYITAVQWYYARQIYLLSKNIYPAIIIVTLTIGCGAVGYCTMSRELAARNFANRGGDVEWMIVLAMGAGVLVDFLITGFMSWALYRNRTGFARTDSIIKTLMAYAINTGLLTSLFGVAVAVTLLVSPKSLIPSAVYSPMGICYINSVLAMLNSRDYIRERISPENTHTSFALSPIRVTAPGEAFGSQYKQTDISVTVHRSTTTTHSHPNIGHAFEGPKLLKDTDIASQCQSRISAENA